MSIRFPRGGDSLETSAIPGTSSWGFLPTTEHLRCEIQGALLEWLGPDVDLSPSGDLARPGHRSGFRILGARQGFLELSLCPDFVRRLTAIPRAKTGSSNGGDDVCRDFVLICAGRLLKLLAGSHSPDFVLEKVKEYAPSRVPERNPDQSVTFSSGGGLIRVRLWWGSGSRG